MKSLRTITLSILIPLIFSACAVAPIPIDNLTYRGTTTVRTERVASVKIESSGLGGRSSTSLMPVGGIFVPIANNSAEPPFGQKDQAEFIQTLKKELVRLGLFRSTDATRQEAGNVDINVRIENSRFNGDRVVYTVQMTMLISAASVAGIERKYTVVSTEKDEGLDGWRTNGAQAREKLAHLMLERLIPDIESFTRGLAPK